MVAFMPSSRASAPRSLHPHLPAVLGYLTVRGGGSHPFASLTYTPAGPPPGGEITCGSYDHPDVGCMAEARDSAAAYLQALLFVLNGTNTYATNAMKV